MDNIQTIGIDEFLLKGKDTTIVDVRTPSEFMQGHIPGAVNIPLFSDEERAEVGTLYKKKGKTEAILMGLDFVGPRMSHLLKQGIGHAGEKKEILIHCWRGGMRSASMAWLFSQAGLSCFLLEGGYKNYRNHILSYFAGDRRAVIIGGLTGSGKTNILKRLGELGEQVIDLEGLACHKGSAFGSLGMGIQPSSEHFANLLYAEMSRTDPGRRLFLEDESRNIGTVFMPDEVYGLIRRSHLLALMSAPATRLEKLAGEYGTFPVEELIGSVRKIEKRLGHELAGKAVEAITEGRIRDAIEIVLVYYDKSYTYGLEKRDRSAVTIIETDTTETEINVALILEAADKAGL